MPKEAGVKDTSMVIAIDNGNSFVKAAFDQLDNILMIPNVIVPSEMKRKVILNQGTPIDNLDIEIVSPALPEGVGRNFHVGILASRNARAQSILGHRAAQMKSQRTETMITTLTMLAFATAMKNQQAISAGVRRLRADVQLGIGLPIAEVAEAAVLEARLTSGVHTVVFKSTPGLEGVSVELSVSLPDGVNVDNVAGIIDLASDPKSTLADKSFGVADLGGIDLDIAFFKPGLELDDYTSTGFRINLNDIVSRIRKDFNASVGQEYLTSDVNVVDRLVHKEYEVRWQGLVKGNISDIANLHLTELARDVLERVFDAWAAAPEAEEFLFIGGGSVILSSYLKELDRQGHPLRFDRPELAQLRNVRGTYRSLIAALQTGAEVAATEAD
ncbi:MAG: ParM/StbA family protein [Alicyclobacillaceae bacterium]|jgi:plasmid segregation protein ParM|uniref:ParM/StbA family protein n=1 Tax=Alicyclobacillus sp. SP_1 TaxID=2942475 RepID=UPI002157F6D2|nr:ParM/StbA family protein [Alicyclobacillus sp. SP_1]MCY0887087.1 ParM/StbA family protein [Alicyclobacillaceae bacterium]MCY0894890.1 ParM/StbA family protein [Alicyclobacillaceae bacterium]